MVTQVPKLPRLNGSEKNIKRLPIPKRKSLLPLYPVLAILCELEVEIKDDSGEDEAHFRVR